MKPISIMWSEGVTEEEAAQAVFTVHQIINSLFRVRKHKRITPLAPAIRPFGTWVIPAVPRGAPYWGTQWYIDRSLDPELNRVRGPDFLRLVTLEPWQIHDPHFDLAILDLELVADPDDAPETPALGLTEPGTATVISVAPLREIADREERLLALRRLVAHHLGHLARVPRPGRTENVDLTDAEPHCTAICAMRHAANVFELLRYAREEREAGVLYCPACEHDMRVQLASAQFNLN
ncbi:MAG TPA: hypothetical protein G4O02_07600 [Caldilineae bacterium]|nr:hypothetical protein [Caldilineae bacterium]